MAVKAFRSLTFILLLSLSVVALTATVHVPTVVAASSGGSGTCGDPDSPKDTGPRPAAQPATQPAQIAAAPSTSTMQAVRWMVVQQLLSSLLGRPGLMR